MEFRPVGLHCTSQGQRSRAQLAVGNWHHQPNDGLLYDAMAFAMLEPIHWRRYQAFAAVDDDDFDGVDVDDGHWGHRHKMWPDFLLACFRMVN